MSDMTPEEIDAQARHWHRVALQLKERAEKAEADNKCLRNSLGLVADLQCVLREGGCDEGDLEELESALQQATAIADETLATPPEGDPRFPEEAPCDAEHKHQWQDDSPSQQPEDSTPEDALAAFDEVMADFRELTDIDPNANPKVRQVRQALTASAPCPHVRTSDGGTSYCTLAEAGSAVPSVPEIKEETLWGICMAYEKGVCVGADGTDLLDPYPEGSNDSRAYQYGLQVGRENRENKIAAAPTKGGRS